MITHTTHCYRWFALGLVILMSLLTLPARATLALQVRPLVPDRAYAPGAASPNSANLNRTLAANTTVGLAPSDPGLDTALSPAVSFAPVGVQYDGDVYTTLVHNNSLYIGGAFSAAGGVLAHSIARWDGSTWHALGSGVRFQTGSISGRVEALAAIGNDLYVGGFFNDAGGVPANHIARWDGSTWHRLSAGVAADAASSPNVTALAVSGTNLFVGGFFSSVDGAPASNIARWDGQRWHTLGSGVNGQIETMAVAQGKLFVGGHFSIAGGVAAERVAAWDGTTWHALGSGLQGLSAFANKMVVSGDDLLVGGAFSTAGDVAGTNNVARWDGTTWHALGAGIAGYGVQAMLLSQNTLYLSTTPYPASHLSQFHRWDGTSWSRFGDDVHELVRTMTMFGDDLVVGGAFEQIGDVYVGGLARWNDDVWHTLGSGNGLSGAADVLLANGTELYVGGSFRGAGAVLVNNIARWDGTRWHALGAGVEGRIYALAMLGSDLFVGGLFEQAGGQPARNIARWDGSAWHNLSAGADSMVTALAVQGNRLFAGGSFNTIGGLPVKYVAQWDGSEWAALGSGLNSDVSALTIHNNELIAAGYFQKSGDRSVRGTARWDGVQWQPLGAGTSAYPGHLVSFQGALYRSMIYSNQISRWDGATWSVLDPGLPDSGLRDGVFAMTADADTLFIALVEVGGPITSSTLARYDGTSWRQLYIIPSGRTSTLGVYGATLFIGGAFLQASGQPSANIAYWRPDMEPQLRPAVWLPAVQR